MSSQPGRSSGPLDLHTALQRALRAEGPYGPERRGRNFAPFDGTVLKVADEALSFADAVLRRSASDPLSDLPRRLFLGFGITARQPPLTTQEARKLWNMLRRMKHLEGLSLEDPDGLLMLIPTNELERMPLSLPNLKYLKYCMTFSVDFCHAFLAGLQRSQLETVVIRFPKEYDHESDNESSDPLTLLAKPCAAATLETLEVENLRYEYFDYSAAFQFPLLGTLSLEFALDSVSPRMPILGYLLSRIPNLSSFDIATAAAPPPLSPHQQPPIADIRATNIHAQANSRTRWSLDRVTGSVLDLWLLGLRCPARLVDISQVDLFTVQNIPSIMFDLFSATSPRALYVAFKETRSSPTDAVMGFLGRLREYWMASPHGSVPKVFELDLSVKQPAKLEILLPSTLALIPSSPRLESFMLNIHFQCKSRHTEPRLNLGHGFPMGHPSYPMVEDDSDDSDESLPEGRRLTQCLEAQHFFREMPGFLRGYQASFQAASARGLQLSIKISSYCSPEGRWLVSGGGARENRVMSWLGST
ncbi:hypothetical protein BD414DRAFT_482391 [Trametes punicea]|nr:hypothetical protein BD414DRAFT_482391 [Trametes punicea]